MTLIACFLQSRVQKNKLKMSNYGNGEFQVVINRAASQFRLELTGTKSCVSASRSRFKFKPLRRESPRCHLESISWILKAKSSLWTVAKSLKKPLRHLHLFLLSCFREQLVTTVLLTPDFWSDGCRSESKRSGCNGSGTEMSFQSLSGLKITQGRRCLWWSLDGCDWIIDEIRFCCRLTDLQSWSSICRVGREGGRRPHSFMNNTCMPLVTWQQWRRVFSTTGNKTARWMIFPL